MNPGTRLLWHDPADDAVETLTAVRLVPVEVFGGECECHEEHPASDCRGWSYGLCDAVESWSDCNRAIGRIFRVDDDWARRLPGQSVTVHVGTDQRVFFEQRWGQVEANHDGAVVRRGIADAAEIEQQRVRIQAVRDAWAKAQNNDLPQGFGWPGDLFDALEAL